MKEILKLVGEIWVRTGWVLDGASLKAQMVKNLPAMLET